MMKSREQRILMLKRIHSSRQLAPRSAHFAHPGKGTMKIVERYRLGDPGEQAHSCVLSHHATSTRGRSFTNINQSLLHSPAGAHLFELGLDGAAQEPISPPRFGLLQEKPHIMSIYHHVATMSLLKEVGCPLSKSQHGRLRFA